MLLSINLIRNIQQEAAELTAKKAAEKRAKAKDAAAKKEAAKKAKAQEAAAAKEAARKAKAAQLIAKMNVRLSVYETQRRM